MGRKAAAPLAGRTGRPPGFARTDAVDAAMNLFWKKGFRAVSASDLADAMSIQRSSFYNSFGSREQVFREALQRYAGQTPDAPLYRVRPGEAVVPILVSVLRDICRVRAADPGARGCLVCNGIAELVGVEKTIGPLLEDAMANMAGAVERLLRQAVQRKELTLPTDAATAAKSFVAFLIGLNTISKVVRSERQLWAMCRPFLRGLGVPGEALGARA